MTKDIDYNKALSKVALSVFHN